MKMKPFFSSKEIRPPTRYGYPGMQFFKFLDYIYNWDFITWVHSWKVGLLSALLANRMGLAPYPIWVGGVCHDFGKYGIPIEERIIFLKPGRPTEEEWAVIKKHPQAGYNIIRQIDGNPALIRAALDCSMSHHENYDGSGYPYGLSGEDIPLEARIVSVADVFDALTAERPYKPGMSLDKALGLMSDPQKMGSSFDPSILEVLLELPRNTLQAFIDLKVCIRT